MKLLKNKTFWVGFAAGTIVGPMVLAKVAPTVRAKIPG